MDLRKPALFVTLAALLILGCAQEAKVEDIAGTWEGTLAYPGFELRMAFEISQPPDGGLSIAVLRPDQDDDRIPATSIDYREGRLRLEAASLNASFEGKLRADGSAIDGSWAQGEWTQPLVLRRVREITKRLRPQTPAPPYPYGEEEVTFENASAQAILSGTLTLPRERVPCPAVLLVSGHGAHDRDYSIMRHKPFLVLADHLTRLGIAVLRVDDRGVGESTGDRSEATTADFAEDALAGVNLLVNHPRIKPSSVGIIGHSEGGTVAALAAARSPDVAFIVMMGAPGVPGEESNFQFEASMGRALGQSKETIEAKRAIQESVFVILKEDTDRTTKQRKLRSLYEGLEPPMPADKIDVAVEWLSSPWVYFNITHDPGVTLRKVKCPVLAIIGGKDTHVPADANLEAIERALGEGGNPDYGIEKLPGLNHFFQTATTGAPSEYLMIEETLSPAALKLISDWILEHVNAD